MAESSDLIDALRTLATITGSAVAASSEPGERIIGTALLGASQAPDIFKGFGQAHRNATITEEIEALKRQETASRQRALSAVENMLFAPLANRTQPVSVPVQGGAPGAAVLDVPRTRQPVPTELATRLSGLLETPGGTTLLETAGFPVRGGLTSRQIAQREAKAAEQQRVAPHKAKLDLLKNIRGMTL